MQSIDKTYLNTEYKDKLFKRTVPAESKQKKTITKVSSGLLINNPDSDSASLSIREENFAKKHFFELLIDLDESITIVNTVISSLASVSQILNQISKLQKDYESNSNPKYHAFLENELSNFTNSISRINTETIFDEEQLVNGSFYKEVKTLNKNKSIIIDFRNPENEGLELSSIDLDIKHTAKKGNLVSKSPKALTNITVPELHTDILQTNKFNLNRMNKSANVVKQRLLIAHKDLEDKMNQEFNKENYNEIKANLFLLDYKTKLEKQSASTILTQVSEDHNGALSLLP